MTPNQINWARQHDWFLGSNGTTVLVRDVQTKDGRIVVDKAIEFTSFSQLAIWAGY